VDVPVVESLNNRDNVDGINTTRSSTGKDGDKGMLLQVERTRVHGERPVGERESKSFGWKCSGHEFPKRERNNLC